MEFICQTIAFNGEPVGVVYKGRHVTLKYSTLSLLSRSEKEHVGLKETSPDLGSAASVRIPKWPNWPPQEPSKPEFSSCIFR